MEPQESHKATDKPSSGKNNPIFTPAVSWEERIQAFREELKQYRNSHFTVDRSYLDISKDAEYMNMLNAGGLATPEDEIQRFYPNAAEIFKKRAPVTTDHNTYSINQHLSKKRAYIKEFNESPDILAAQMAQLKAQMAKEGPGSELSVLMENLKSEIPLSKQDLERYIGENLLFKIGVLIILIAVTVLYRYGMSVGLIKPGLQLVVGVLLGTGFATWAHFLAKASGRFITLLVALANLSFYYTFKLAVKDYDMLPSWAGFALGLIVLSLSITASLRYDRKWVGIVALIGAYALPLAVGTPKVSMMGLFIYLSFVHITMLVVAVYQRWHLLLSGTYFMFILFTGIILFFRAVPYSRFYLDCIFFISLQAIVIFVMTMAYNIRKNTPYSPFSYYLLLLLNLSYLSLMLYIFSKSGQTGAMTVVMTFMAVLQFYYAVFIYAKGTYQESIREQLLVTAILLIVFAVFFEFKMLYVNSLWALLSVLFVWLGLQTQNVTLRNSGAFLVFGALLSMLYNWGQTYWSADTLPFVLNAGFWSSVVTVGSLSLIIQLYNADEEKYEILAFDKNYYTKLLGSFLLVIGYLTGLFELLWNTPDLVGGGQLRIILIDAYTMTYTLLVRYIVYTMDISRMKFTVGLMITLSVVVYLLFGHAAALSLRTSFIIGELPIYPFLFHYINTLLSILLVYLQITDVIKFEGYTSGKYTTILWFMGAVAVFHLTYEFEHSIVLFSANLLDHSLDEALEQVRLTGFSVLWSVISFGFMYLGIRYKLKELRVISLVLLGITLVKFFIFDFWKLALVGRITALIIIGFIFLAVSALYTRLKTLVQVGYIGLDRDKPLSQEELALFFKLTKKKQAESLENDDDEEENP